MRIALKQLCRTMESLPPELEELYKRHYGNDSQPKYDGLRIAYLAIIRQIGCIFFVLDALDECTLGQRKDLLAFIFSLTNTTSAGADQGVVKLFITIRKESDIERAFQQIPTIEVEAAKVDSDIDKYVRAQMELRLKDGTLRLRNMSLKERILSVLTSKAGGMCVSFYPSPIFKKKKKNRIS